MCRNIRPLFHFDPPSTDDEIQAAARQFVRKISGFPRPSQANQAACDRAVAAISQVSGELLASLQTHAPRKNRAVEAAKAKARSADRYFLPS